MSFLHGLRSVFLPCSELWVCALQPLWVAPHKRPPVQNCMRSGCFCRCPHSSRWLLSADCSQKSRPQETCLYKSQEHILSGHSSYPLAALQTQRERHAIQLHFPPTRAEFILKKRRCEVCAVEIINDLDCDGAVITDCGA